MVRGHCRGCKALMVTEAPRHYCDACIDALNARLARRWEEDQERFDAMSAEEREVYYEAAYVAWRKEQYGRLDA